MYRRRQTATHIRKHMAANTLTVCAFSATAAWFISIARAVASCAEACQGCGCRCAGMPAEL
eukprot:276509-Alexandrium_andersonii.AAC.1